MYSSFSLVTFKAAIQELLTLKPQELRPRSEKIHRELRLEDLMKVSEHFVLLTKLRFSHWSCWGFRSSGIWCCVLGWVASYRFKELSVSFFKGQGVQVQILDCLTFEDEGTVILWNNQEPLTQWHSDTSQNIWIIYATHFLGNVLCIHYYCHSSTLVPVWSVMNSTKESFYVCEGLANYLCSCSQYFKCLLGSYRRISMLYIWDCCSGILCIIDL